MKLTWLKFAISLMSVAYSFLIRTNKKYVFVSAHLGCSTRLYESHCHNLNFDDSKVPPWAANIKPPDQEILETLYLEHDDFVSVELENESDVVENFYATVLYANADEASRPRYHVEPCMGTITPNGGLQEVSVMPILDEDSKEVRKEAEKYVL